MAKKRTFFNNQGLDDFMLSQPDFLKVNSARRVHEIHEQLANMKRPIDETNEKLTDIEGHSGKMNELSVQAAISNKKAARSAFYLSVVAIFIAVLMPAIQIGYNELWRAQKETQATQAIISDLKAEISDLKRQQTLTLENLSNAMADKEKDTITILEDIKEVLERSHGNSIKQKDDN